MEEGFICTNPCHACMDHGRFVQSQQSSEFRKGIDYRYSMGLPKDRAAVGSFISAGQFLAQTRMALIYMYCLLDLCNGTKTLMSVGTAPRT